MRLLLSRDVFDLILIIAALILYHVGEHEILRNSHDEEEPEQVDALERGEKRECDALAEPAFVLSCFPVQIEWADRLEGRQDGPDDL